MRGVPGVATTGPFNAHFVGDIGFAFLAGGVSLMLGARNGRAAAVVASARAVWPALHGLFHVYGWITAGFPTDAEAAAVEVFGVVLACALGVVLSWFRIKGEAKC
jgi:TRAP-type mannitol/chloroaromatic compound transport system permease large subunit